MNLPELHVQIALGEDSSRQFKVDIRNAESLASEMGLGREDVNRINQLISNAASQLVRSPLTILRRPAMAARGRATEETSGKASGKILAAIRQNTGVTIPELAAMIGVSERSIERNIQNLQKAGQLRRIGPAKGGYWEIVE